MKQSRKHYRHVVSLLLLIFFGGCTSVPTQEQLAMADYGADMSPSECASIAEHLLANALKDPGSAQFRNAPCFKSYWGSAPILGMKIAYGWLQTGEINGKNSYGGYVGFRKYQVLIKDGAVVRYCMFDDQGECMPTAK